MTIFMKYSHYMKIQFFLRETDNGEGVLCTFISWKVTSQPEERYM